MYSEKLESLISDIIADGEIEEAEMNVLKKAAVREGEDPDELEIVIKGRLAKMKKQESESNSSSPSMPNATQSDKIGGTAMRCPACGALYVVGTAACPECGYAFSGIKSTRSSEKLYETLLKFNEENKIEKMPETPTGAVGSFFGAMGMDKSSMKKMYNLGDDGESDIARRKMDVIKDFPVPNSREDLIDFLTSIQPKADPSAPKSGMTGWGVPGTAIGSRQKKEDLGYAYWLLYANCINKARLAFASDPDFAPFFAFYDAKNQGSATSESSSKASGLFGKFFGKK
jgi:hypothetical protein